jgi:hypothetical protein
MLGLGKGDRLKCPEKATPSNRSSAGYGYKTIIRFIKNLKLAPIPAWEDGNGCPNIYSINDRST